MPRRLTVALGNLNTYIRIMASSGLRGALHRLKSRVADAIVQDCPPELYACEVCSRLQCSSEEWLTCEKRLAAAQFMRTGDMAALERLKLIRRQEDAACMPKSRGLAAS